MTESPISVLRGQAWPMSGRNYRREAAELADEGLRTVYCGFCGAKSPELDGPSGRAWFAGHSCRKTHLRLISVEP